ncbi:MAG: type II secretion system protein E [Desulfobacterales bacterium PC51MH44]|nr:MAG: type II secretion system protein E [Desulfobacterales bacterium PC51MH44]
MQNNLKNPFSAKNVCRILLGKGLATNDQVKEIFRKKDAVKEKLERLRDQRLASSLSAFKIINPITIVDIIHSLELSRTDKPSWPLDEEIIFQALAKEWDIPYKKIDPLKLDLNLVTTTIPRTFAMKHLVLPIAIQNGYLTVATPNPFNMEVMEDLVRVTQLKVKTVVSSKTDIIKSIDEFFGFKRSIAMAEDMFATTSVDIGNLEQYVKLKSAEELPPTDHHIVNAVNHLLIYAFDQKASDIHIEPKRDELAVRMRIDGVLHTVYKLPKKVHNAIVSRIKALSRLDMAEKRRPQDGRIKTDKGGVEAEIRISTVPVAFGEKVVMRVMDPEMLFQDLKGLGFTGVDLNRFNPFISMPHGIVLVCGPTGSGKSTTLYSALRYLSSPEINIMTVEDPIEMINEEFNQIAVQPALDITFATIIRTILRQDPDIIMIGEMRDLETAASAVQAALTGHLVLSTLHTNDAPSVITRLLDLGIPAFMIQATLVGVLGQRLVRVICNYCKESFEIDTAELGAMSLELGKKSRIIKLHRGIGCVRCRGTGYRGRTGIFEVLPYTDSLKDLTASNTDITKLSLRARKEGMITLRENAIKKMLAGKTTYQEVLRVTWEQA